MIRTVTVLGLLVAVGAAMGLYHLKLRTGMLADRVAELNQQIDREEEAISVLRAEWSLLNQPDRLQALAERHLELAPLDADQIVGVEGLSLHLAAGPPDARVDDASTRYAHTPPLPVPR